MMGDDRFVPGEPFFVPLRERHIAVLRDHGPSPEEGAMAREEAAWVPRREEDDEPARGLPPEVEAMIDTALPLEEALIFRQAMAGVSQRQIAAELGIRQPSVQARLSRATMKLRLVAQRGSHGMRSAGTRMKLVELVAVCGPEPEDR